MIKTKIIQNTEIDAFLNENDYAKAASLLFENQLLKWIQLKERYEALKNIKTKEFRFKGFKIKVQFNPGRIKSTSAKTDDDSIDNRECFLCLENLPKPQKGIILSSKYILLCNPFPIFTEHFTICTIKHEPQNIINHFEEMLNLTKHLSKEYFLIYNGPACGASAPDHFHFQAAPNNLLLITEDYHQLKNEYGKVIIDDAELILTSVDDGLRRFLVFESTDMKKIIKTFKMFYKSYAQITSLSNEPMFNIVSTFDHEFGWSLIIFLREKHRPVYYYKKGDEKLLISPAAVDLAGLLIAPREKDFDKITSDTIEKIFKEVSLNDKHFFQLTNLLEGKYS